MLLCKLWQCNNKARYLNVHLTLLACQLDIVSVDMIWRPALASLPDFDMFELHCNKLIRQLSGHEQHSTACLHLSSATLGNSGLCKLDKAAIILTQQTRALWDYASPGTLYHRVSSYKNHGMTTSKHRM